MARKLDKKLKVILGIVLAMIVMPLIGLIVMPLIGLNVLNSYDSASSAPPLPEGGFVLVDAVQVTGSTSKIMTLVNCVNYPSNTEEVIVSICSCSDDFFSSSLQKLSQLTEDDSFSSKFQKWNQPTETDITGFLSTVTINSDKKRYFAVKCSNEEFQIVPKKIKKKLYVFVYTKDANPNQEIIYPYFKHENATIFSRSELPKGCNKGISFSGVKKGVSFTVYAYSSRDTKWTTFATVEFDEEKVCSVEYLTSTHDVTEYDFIAIDATDDRSYKYVLSGKRGKLCVNVINHRDDDLN